MIPLALTHHTFTSIMIFAIDFDGTMVTHAYPDIGRDIGAVPVIKRLVQQGHQIILWTMRSYTHLSDAVSWCEANGIPLYGVNRNPGQDWSVSPKAHANVYIDDAALGVPLVRPAGQRPYVDWAAVEYRLVQDGYITP